MARMKGFAGILGVTVLMAVVAACGSGAEPTSLSDGVTTPTDSTPATTPIVSHGGPVKDYVSLVDNLRAAGATVDPAGTGSGDYFPPQNQLLTVNGERVSTFEFDSAEAADATADGVSAGGSSIVTTMPDGTGTATMVTWVAPPHFYKAGKLIVLYVGCDSDVINLLQETIGPQFAGGAGVPPCPERVPPNTLEIRQALEAAEGSEVSVKGFLVADRDGRTRLCSGLLESYPPQCGGDQIELLEFDASSVPNSKTPQRPSEIPTARWTDSHITVTGIKVIGGLAEVRLSTEALAPVGGTAAPGNIEPVPAATLVLTPIPTPIPTITVIQFGTPDSDFASGVAIDGTGNVYVVGDIQAGALPGQTSLGDADAYLRKYDGHGNEIWTRQFGTQSEDHATGVRVDGAGNVYVVGLTRGAFPGHTGLVGIDYDAYIRKYDGDGNELWTRQFGTPRQSAAQGEDHASDVAVDGGQRVRGGL